MGSGVTGSTAAAKRLAERLGNAGRMLPAIAKAMSEEALNLVAEGFKSGTDPYGKPWNAPNDLQITGRLRRFVPKPFPAGFRLVATDKKAIWHHDPQPRKAWGGKSLPTRLLVPTKAQGIPPTWSKRLKAAAVDAFEVFVGK